MNEKQLENITKLLMIIPSQMCRKIGREVSKLVFEQIGQNLAIYHLMILKIIQDEGAEHVSEVGNILGISKSQMTAATNRLIELNLIERQNDPKDRRKIILILTTEGEKTAKEADKHAAQFMKERLSSFSNEELEKIENGLNQLFEVSLKL